MISLGTAIPVPTPDPQRAAFLIALQEHEDLVNELASPEIRPGWLERFRVSHRKIVALYDRATLHIEPKQ